MEATGPTTETTSSTTEATGPTTETRALTTKATASTAETPAPTYFREFARLYPTNKTAALAFDRVASKVKADPNWNRHARKYIAIFPDQASLECVGSESESEDGSGPQPHKRLIQIGYYRLNFDMPPRDPRLGWLIGGGKFALGDESPELVLTERKRHDGILGRHAQLFHNYSSGALMLRVSDQSIAIVGGKNVRGLTAIWSITTHISFGNMTYRLDLDDATDGIHQRRLNHYRQINDLAVTDGHVSLLSTPAESDYIHKEYVIKNPVGHGASSTIFAGEHIKTGTAVAVKRMIRDRDNAGSIKQEVQMAKFLGSHVRLLQVSSESSDLYLG